MNNVCAIALPHKGSLFLVPVSPPVRFEGAKIAFFFERAIFEKCWWSAALALRFLAVSRFLVFFGRPPVHFVDLELTGTKKLRV